MTETGERLPCHRGAAEENGVDEATIASTADCCDANCHNMAGCLLGHASLATAAPARWLIPASGLLPAYWALRPEPEPETRLRPPITLHD